jgi:hypothetical protein
MSDFIEDYEPIFQLGFYKKQDPAILILKEAEMCPVALAGLVTALFETVMKTVSDEKQIEFESAFNESLKVLMQQRFDYEVTVKYPEDE